MPLTKVGPFVNGGPPALSAGFLTALENKVAAAATQGIRVKTIAGSGESQDVKDACDYVCDGVADEVQINQALVDVTAGGNTTGKGTSGGLVILVGRQFEVADAIAMRSYSKLLGAYGKFATWVTGASGYTPGAAGGLVELFDLNTQYVDVEGVSLNGAGRNVCGYRFEVGTGFEFDAFLTVKESYVWNVGAVGLYNINQSGGRNRGCMFERIRIINAGSHGVHIAAPDSFYSQIDVGSAGGHGFYVAHANNRIVNCKAWFADQSGFMFDSPGRDTQVSACESQDNFLHGYHVGHARVTLAGCCADSNGYNGTTSPTMQGDGFHLTANGFNIQGTASDKRESSHGGVSHQRYGVNYAAANLRGIVNVTTWQNAAAAKNGTPAAGSVDNVVDMT